MSVAPGKSLENLRAQLAGTNIDPDTLLATDYLNHFNEIIMMLELVPDMPEMLDDAKSWSPMSYAEHFRHSQFAERDLAIEAYEFIPDRRRIAFEDAVAEAHACVEATIAQLGEAMATDASDNIRPLCAAFARDMHLIIDRISIIIHGGEGTAGQAEADTLLPAEGQATLDQSAIDDLFK